MHKYFHLQAYELLSVLCISDPKEYDSSKEKMKELALALDGYYMMDEFIELYRKAEGRHNEDRLNDEALFVNYENLSLYYTNQEILVNKDRLILYVCIRAWILRYGFSLDISSLSIRVLAIDELSALSINEFLQEEDNQIDSGRNVFIYLEPLSKSGDSLDGNWIKSNQPRGMDEAGLRYLENIETPMKVLYIDSLKMFFTRCRDMRISIGKEGKISQCGLECVEPGDSIEINGEVCFDYYDLKRIYLTRKNAENLMLRARNVSFTHAPGKSIKRLNLNIESGTLVGILGKEGSGKSTILDLLAGEIIPSTGDISINAYSYNKELYYLKGMIGYVPEEDILFDELTVYDNLYYSAKLYLGNQSDKEIAKRVKELLIDLNLWHISNSVVGTYNEKNLQPGQRRLLNIALELIRDPQLLIVDNATAPLSLSDSSKIIEVLAAYTFKGRIVITSITQTEKKIFQYFDRILLLDDGGFPILYKKVGEVWSQLLSAIGLPQITHQQPGPNEILELMNQPAFNSGNSSSDRYKSSDELYNYFNENSGLKEEKKDVGRKILPKNILQPPTLERQYMIFNLRNFKTKLSRTRELLITLVSAPLLAFLLALVLRDSMKAGYSFHENLNIPIFFYFSFLIAVFMGLVLSAREVFRERRIIQKQAYLNISKFSYINSKITYLFIIAVVQSFLFIIISHGLLQIKGMLWMHWLIYFSCQSFGLLVGLVLSESHRNLSSIYSRTIPIIILLQLLFGGGVIQLDTLANHKKHTPLIAEFMVTRWAHEAMMVYQFSKNEYNTLFYSFDRDYSLGRFNAYYQIPWLKDHLEYCENNYIENPDSVSPLLRSMEITLHRFPKHYDIFPYENINSLNISDFNSEIAADLSEYLEYLNLSFFSLFENASELIDQKKEMISDSLGKEYLPMLAEKYTNKAVISEVTNASSRKVIETSVLPPVQLIDQVYQYPDSDIGRAQFFLPAKSINGQVIDTIEFNISIIWLFNLFIYILLLTSIFSSIGGNKSK